MKLDRALTNNRKKAIIIKARGRTWEFPFSKLVLKPTSDNPIESVEVDSDTGKQSFTYKLKDGQEDTVPGEAILDIYGDPEYLKKLHLYNLTVTAQKTLSQKKLSKRALARKLNTSPKQLYRLLDQTFYGKTIDQMIRLLNALDVEVEIKTSPRKKAA